MRDGMRRPGWSTPRVWILLISGLWVAGCQSTTRVGDRFYESGKYPEAAAAFQSYLESEPSDNDQIARTLYRLGVVLATPGSSVYDPQASVETLDSLLRTYPGCTYVPEATLLRNLQLKIVQLEKEMTHDRERLAELQVDLAQREAEIAGIALEIGAKNDQIEALQESIPPLRVEIRQLIRELATKEQDLEQLERLKAIDLAQPPP